MPSKFMILLALMVGAPTAVFAQAMGMVNVPASLRAENNNYGQGLYGANQPCGYGNQRAVATEGDDEIKEMLMELKGKKVEQKKARTEYLQALREYNAMRNKLQRALGSNESAEEFMANAVKCQDYYLTNNCSSDADREQCLYKGVGQYYNSTEGPSKEAEQCKHAVWASWQQSKSKNLNAAWLCVGPKPGTNQSDVITAVNPRFADSAKLNECRDAARGIIEVTKNKMELEKAAGSEQAKSEIKDLETLLKKRKKEIASEKAEAKKIDDEIRKIERELGESDEGEGSPGMRDNGNCSYCSIMQAALAQRREEAKMMAWTTVADTAIGAAAYYFAANAASRRNAALGYPTGYGAFVPQMGFGILQGLMGAYGQYAAGQNSNAVMVMGTGGYPFANGGTYGGINGGMAGGSWGCAPTIYMTNGTPNFNMGNNMGGVYNSGYIPGFGYPGPQYGGGVQAGTFGPGYNMYSGGMPGMYPGMGMGMGGAAGAGMYPPGMYPGMGMGMGGAAGAGMYPPGMYPPGMGMGMGGAGYPPGYGGSAYGYGGGAAGYPPGYGGAGAGGMYGGMDPRYAQAMQLSEQANLLYGASMGNGFGMTPGPYPYPYGTSAYGAGMGAFPPGFGAPPVGLGFNASINAGFGGVPGMTPFPTSVPPPPTVIR